MPSKKLSALAVLLSAAAMLSAGCATQQDPTANMTPEEIYAQAKEEIENIQYAKGIDLLEKVESRAAGTPLAQQAQLDIAYTHYKAEERAQALATLERFLRLHPASPAIDYALYLKGLVNFNENRGLFGSLLGQDLSERDQLAAKESYAAFQELATRFPNSRYTPDAKARMTYIVNSLARYEVHVAHYYLKKRAYVAAINRAQQAIVDYREAPALEEALHILVQCYEALHMPALRDDALRVLRANYPQSGYLSSDATVMDPSWWKFW